MSSVAQISFFFLDEKREEGTGWRRGYRLKTTKKEKMEPWVLQRALQRQFMRTIGITNMLLVLCFIPIQAQSSIIIFINGVRFSSECKNKLFSLEIFLPTSLLVPSNGIQKSEDMSEYRRKKKIPTCNLRSRHYSMSLVRNKWRMKEAPDFCTLAAVYSRLLATWAMGDIHFQRNHEMALKWSL